jgi:hypothetical protein
VKSIIRGKRFDTERAEQVAKFGRGYAGDFGRFEEALYRTARGSWFLAGAGGPMTQYSQVCDDGRSRSGGERIIPLTPEQAREWLEQHEETGAVERYFADELEDA